MKKGVNGLRRKRFRIKDADYETQECKLCLFLAPLRNSTRIKKRGELASQIGFCDCNAKVRERKALKYPCKSRIQYLGFYLRVELRVNP